MDRPLMRQELILGEESTGRLSRSRVAVFGLGGVGSYAAEALARCGIGYIALIDGDVYSASNLNRQLFATAGTLGMPKTQAAAQRLRNICPDIGIEEHPIFYTPKTAGEVDLSRFDYLLDAVDMVSAKLELICRAAELGVPIISCMGAGNKLEPTAFRVADIYETSVCPLARVMRRELRRRGVKRLQVVYSQEPPSETGGDVPGSVAFVPSVAGLIMAGEAVKYLAGGGRDGIV